MACKRFALRIDRRECKLAFGMQGHTVGLAVDTPLAARDPRVATDDSLCFQDVDAEKQECEVSRLAPLERPAHTFDGQRSFRRQLWRDAAVGTAAPEADERGRSRRRKTRPLGSSSSSPLLVVCRGGALMNSPSSWAELESLPSRSRVSASPASGGCGSVVGRGVETPAQRSNGPSKLLLMPFESSSHTILARARAAAHVTGVSNLRLVTLLDVCLIVVAC